MLESLSTRCSTALFAVGLTFGLSANAGDKEALSLMSDMSQAVGSQNFSGTVMFGSPSRWESARIQQTYRNQGLVQRTDYLTGIERSQIRALGEIVCIHEGQHQSGMTPDVLKPFGHNFPTSLAALDQSYDFALADLQSERVAGRQTVSIWITPEHPDRYAHQIWLDKASKLPLKAEMTNEQGIVLRRYQFVSLDTEFTMPDNELRAADVGHTLHFSKKNGIDVSPESDWFPSWLPQGFHIQQAIESDDNIRMTFSDGLASFSLFVDRVGQGRSSSSRVSRQWGPVSATVEDILTQDGQRVRLSVVGGLPPMTLDKVLDSAIPSYSLSMK